MGKTHLGTFAETHPHLLGELVALGDFDPEKHGAGSQKIATWLCELCNEGYAKEVRKRVQGYSCPTCCGSLLPERRLMHARPELAAQWHPTRNGARTVHNTSAKANFVAWWRDDLGHEWPALVGNRARGYGCPYCGMKKLLKGFNDLATLHPHLAQEFSSANEVSPAAVLGAGGQWLWDCSTCSTRWKTSITSRARKGSGCPKCAKKELAKTLSSHALRLHGSLALVRPDLLSEWDYDLNSLSPEEVSVKSWHHAHWKCNSCNESWKYQIAKKTARTVRCPSCFPRRILEQEICEAVEGLTKAQILTNERKILPSGRELDLYLPTLRLAIEINGTYWHSDAFMRKTKGISAQEYHESKLEEAAALGITLSFVWEHDWHEAREEVLASMRILLHGGGLTPLLRKLAAEEEDSRL